MEKVFKDIYTNIHCCPFIEVLKLLSAEVHVIDDTIIKECERGTDGVIIETDEVCHGT